ncbi:MAG: HutD family protein [Eubacteriales bacterium]|nr:HutD family protein [Eubacteriales bacterium]
MIRRLTPADYVTSTWSGGTTTQLAIYPDGALYADRDFLWRISSATVDLPESDYTSLPEYYRFITPLNGEMRLTHDGGEEINVEPLEVHEFDGESATHCVGKCTDFNLMLRKELTDGFMSTIEMDDENGILINPCADNQTILIYVVKGSAFIEIGDMKFTANEGEAFLINDEPYENLLQSDDCGIILMAGAETI